MKNVSSIGFVLKTTTGTTTTIKETVVPNSSRKRQRRSFSQKRIQVNNGES